MTMKTNIAELKNVNFKNDQIFTMYLSTESDRGTKPEWKIRFKNGLKKLKEYSEIEGNEEKTLQFKQTEEKIEKALNNDQTDLKNGCLIVASQNYWFFEKFQVPVPNAFYWSEHPHLEELDDLMERYPTAGVIMVSNETVTVLDTFLGVVDQEWRYEWDIDTEDWKEKQGLAQMNRETSGSSYKERFDKRFEVNQQRWLKSLCPILENSAKVNQWKEFIVTGESQLSSALIKNIKLKNIKVMSKNINTTAHHKVLQKVYVG